MNLLIDIGNTRIKFGYALTGSAHLQPHTLAVTASELTQLSTWLAHYQLHPKRALIISVAKPEVEQLVLSLLHAIHCEAIWLNSLSYCPLLHNGYDQPEQLGADRWFALIGVLQTHLATTRPLIHASFGTATTIDTVLPATATQKAIFNGGLILPGPQLMYESLATKTAKLGYGIGNMDSFPNNTRAAISTGIASAQAGAVMRQWQLVYELQVGPPLLVCSGGGWELVQQEVERAHAYQRHQLALPAECIYYQPTPVLDGLAYMATQS